MSQELIHFRDQVALLKSGSHDNPHSFLGLHENSVGEKVIRLWAPKKSELSFEYLGEIVQATLADSAGLFTYHVPKNITRLDYRVFHLYLFHQGIHYGI